jgi:hypothetical protein
MHVARTQYYSSKRPIIIGPHAFCLCCYISVTGDATLSLCSLEVEFAFRVTGAISPDAESMIKTFCGDFLSLTDGDKLLERFDRC